MTRRPEHSSIRIRDFQEEDAPGISALFREVYGERYVYPEVYLPSVICQRNHDGSWQSAVASIDGRIVAHAALLRTAADARLRELAMLAASGSVLGQGTGVRVCRHLCQRARRSGMRMLYAMLVCSHRQSQRLATPLGFSTSGLMLDYLPSSFSAGERESYVLSCLPLQDMPLPDVDWPAHCDGWLDALLSRHGRQLPVPAHDLPPIEVRSDGELLAVTIHGFGRTTLDEACQLPAGRPRLVRLRAAPGLASAAQQLHQAGLRHTGLMPGPDGSWYWLMQAGFKAERVDLHCDLARAMFDTAQGC